MLINGLFGAFDVEMTLKAKDGHVHWLHFSHFCHSISFIDVKQMMQWNVIIVMYSL